MKIVMDERRRFERKNFNIPCRFEVEGQTVEGQVANMSTCGICVRKASEIPSKGSEISITLQLSPGYDCQLKAQVVRIQPSANCFGVEFLSPLSLETGDPSLMDLLN